MESNGRYLDLLLTSTILLLFANEVQGDVFRQGKWNLPHRNRQVGSPSITLIHQIQRSNILGYHASSLSSSLSSQASSSSSALSVADVVTKISRGGQGYYSEDYGSNRDGDDAYGRKYKDGNDAYIDDDRYYEDDRYYDDKGGYDRRDRGYAKKVAAGTPGDSPLDSVRNKIQKGDRRIGLILLTSGAVVTLLGISLFFNKQLMRLGNLLFFAGVPMTIGPGRTAGYFLQPQKARSTACLALGVVLVFIGKPLLGILLEIFGLMNLFGNMFPLFFAILKQMPVIGPFVTNMTTKGSGGRTTRPSRDYDYDDNDDDSYKYNDRDYYDDRSYNDGGRGDNNDDDEYGRNYY